MHLVCRRFDTTEIIRLELDGGVISQVTPQAPVNRAGASVPWIAPAFVDLQVNGYGGQEFSSTELSIEAVERIVHTMWQFGVTAFCPTLTTQSFACLQHGMRTIAEACERVPRIRQCVAGIHLEGPYFSKEDGPRGAHPVEHCRAPDWNEFARLQEAAGGRIRILTMSCEFDEAPDFIRRASASGVLVAIGHTGANGEQIRRAVDAGARLSTHLGNGAHRTLPRHPNYIWDQLAEDRLWASLIVDGQHLPPEVVRVMVRAKTPGRIVLVSDLSGLAGLPVGRHESSGGPVEVLHDGRLVIAGQTQLLAGASRPIGVGVANLMRFARLDLGNAVDLATVQPARLIGARVGGLRPGDPADLVLFELDASGELHVQATILSGECVFGRVTSGL